MLKNISCLLNFGFQGCFRKTKYCFQSLSLIADWCCCDLRAPWTDLTMQVAQTVRCKRNVQKSPRQAVPGIHIFCFF